jgi:RimJ/RimL family protein N-acetyltransferase
VRLRAFALSDAPEVQLLCSAREIATGTLEIPHPYPDGAAEEWISSHGRDDSPTWAIERKDDGALVGAMSLRREPAHNRAELGYWIGVPYWNRGYATEAALAVLRHAFEALGLNRVYAYHFTNNPASGRVLQKIGMVHEGRRRAHTRKWGEYLDNEAYGILRSEWTARVSE